MYHCLPIDDLQNIPTHKLFYRSSSNDSFRWHVHSYVKKQNTEDVSDTLVIAHTQWTHAQKSTQFCNVKDIQTVMQQHVLFYIQFVKKILPTNSVESFVTNFIHGETRKFMILEFNRYCNASHKINIDSHFIRFIYVKLSLQILWSTWQISSRWFEWWRWLTENEKPKV